MKNSFVFFITLILAFMTLGFSYAQNYKIYAASGPWQIAYDETACYAIANQKVQPSLFVMMAKDENRVILNFGKYGAWIKQGKAYFVNFTLGQGLDFHGMSEGKVGTELGGNLFFPKFPNQYLEHFAKASSLIAEIKDGPKVPKISLKGSGQMLKVLRQCVAKKL